METLIFVVISNRKSYERMNSRWGAYVSALSYLYHESSGGRIEISQHPRNLAENNDGLSLIE